MTFRMATDPLSKGKPSNQNSSKKDEDGEGDSKLTVLESHGYTLGKTIGVGTFATVKVSIFTLCNKYIQ